MAKNDLDKHDDLDDLDSMFDDFDENYGEPKDDRSPTLKIASSFLEGVVESFTSTSTISKLLRRALPRGYGDAVDKVDDVVTRSKDLYDKAVKSIAPEAKEFAKMAKKSMPRDGDFLSDATTKRLDDLWDRMGASDDEWRPPTQAETDNLNMGGELANIFKLNGQVQIELERAREGRERAREVVRGGLSRASISVLETIASNSTRLVNYQDEITNKWQRKSLELQYRHMFLTRDLVEITKRASVDKINELKAIAKNTGLPEIAKITLSEQSGKMFRERIIGKSHDTIADFTNNYLDSIFKRFGETADDATDAIKQLLSAGTTAGDMTNLLSDQENPSKGREAIFKIFAQMAGQFTGDWGAGKVGDYLKPFLDKIPMVKSMGSKAEYISENFPHLISEWANNYSDDDSMMGDLTNLLKYQFSGYRKNNVLTQRTLGDTAEQPAIWDKLQRRTITEIIPGLLARQLRELQIANGADPSIGLTRFDFDTETFSTDEAIKANIVKRTLGGFNKESFDLSLKRLGEIIFEGEGEGTSKATRKLVMERLRNEMLDDKGFVLSRYLKSDGSKESDAIAGAIRKAFGLNAEDRLGMDNEAGNAKLAETAREFNWLRDSMANVSKGAFKYTGLNQKDLLHDIGLIKRENGRDVIDYDFLRRYLNGDDSTQRPNGGGPTPGPDTLHGGGGEPGAGDRSGNGGVGGSGNPIQHNYQVEAKFPEWFNETLVDEHHKELVDTIKANNVHEQLGELNASLGKLAVILSGPLNWSGGDAGANRESNPERVWRWFTSGVSWTAGKTVDVVKGIGTLYGRGTKFVLDKIKYPWRAAKWGVKKSYGLMFDEDIYVKGHRKPALTVQGIKEGLYIDERTKKVIKELKDITGPVVDSNGNYCVTEEDFKTGLVTRSGIGVLLNIGKGAFSLGKDLIDNTYGTMLRVGWRALRATGRFISKAFNYSAELTDAYIKGEEIPRVYASLLRAGRYFDKDGNVVKSLKGFFEDLYDEHGNIVLNAKEIEEGLYDRFGNKLDIRIKMVARKAGRLARSLLKLPGKIIKGAVDLFGKGVSAIFRAGATMADWMLGGISIQIGNGNMLKRIYDLLDQRLPGGKRRFSDSDGDGMRDGSWEEKAKDAADEAKNSSASGGKGPGKDKSESGLFASLAGLFGGKKKKDESDTDDAESDESSLMDEITDEVFDGDDGGDGDSNENRRRRRRRGIRRRMRGKGVWGKIKELAKWGAEGGKDLAKRGWGVTKRAGTGLAKWGLRQSGSVAAKTAIGFVGVLAAPEVAVAATIATTAWTIYDIYDAFMGNVKGKIAEFRFAQYGAYLSDEERAARILALEELLHPHLTYTKGVAVLKNTYDRQKCLGLFGSGAEYMEDWFNNWFDRRFLPIFMAHNTATYKLLGKAIKLADVEREIPKTAYMSYVSLTSFNFREGSPYAYTGWPFDGNMTYVTPHDIEYLASLVRKEGSTATSDFKKVVADAKTRGGGDYHSQTGSLNASPYSYTTTAPVTTKGEADRRYDKLSDKAASYVWRSPKTNTSSNIVDLGALDRKRLDPLSIVKVRAYGLVDLDTVKVKALLGLESAVVSALNISSDGKASFAGSASQYYDMYGPAFGCKPDSNADRVDWSAWFDKRFIPILTNYVSGVRSISKDAPLMDAWHYLAPKDSLSIAEQVVATTVSVDGKNVPIWVMSASPFPTYTVSNTSAVVDGNMNLLRNAVSKNQIPDMFAKLKQSGNDQQGSSSFINLLNSGRKDRPTAPSLLRNGNLPASGSTSVSNWSGGGTPGVGWTPSGVVPTGSAIGDGFEAVKDTIYKAADMTGQDRGLMAALAGMESSYRTTAKPTDSRTTAKGLYQFVDDTWTEMLTKYGAKYGLTPSASPYDPMANSLMGGEYLKENTEAFRQKFGRDPAPVEMYLMHFLGGTGGSSFISKAILNPTGAAAYDFPGPASTNEDIFYTKDKMARSYADIYQLFSERMGKFWPKDAGSPATAPAKPDDFKAEIPTIDPVSTFAAEGMPVSQEDLAAAAAARASTKAIRDKKRAGQNSVLSKINQTNGSASKPVSKPASNFSGGMAALPAAAAASYAESPVADDATPTRQYVETRASEQMTVARTTVLQQSNSQPSYTPMLSGIGDTLTKSLEVQKATLEEIRGLRKDVGKVNLNPMSSSGSGSFDIKTPAKPAPKATPPVSLKAS